MEKINYKDLYENNMVHYSSNAKYTEQGDFFMHGHVINHDTAGMLKGLIIYKNMKELLYLEDDFSHSLLFTSSLADPLNEIDINNIYHIHGKRDGRNIKLDFYKNGNKVFDLKVKAKILEGVRTTLDHNNNIFTFIPHEDKNLGESGYFIYKNGSLLKKYIFPQGIGEIKIESIIINNSNDIYFDYTTNNKLSEMGKRKYLDLDSNKIESTLDVISKIEGPEYSSEKLKDYLLKNYVSKVEDISSVDIFFGKNGKRYYSLGMYTKKGYYQNILLKEGNVHELFIKDAKNFSSYKVDVDENGNEYIICRGKTYDNYYLYKNGNLMGGFNKDSKSGEQEINFEVINGDFYTMFTKSKKNIEIFKNTELVESIKIDDKKYNIGHVNMTYNKATGNYFIFTSCMRKGVFLHKKMGANNPLMEKDQFFFNDNIKEDNLNKVINKKNTGGLNKF